jgi:hypothetical protein
VIDVQAGASIHTDKANNTMFQISGESPTEGSVRIEHSFDGSSFAFGLGGKVQTVVFEHPSMRFISNEFDFFAAYHPVITFPGGSIPELITPLNRVIINGLAFDQVAFQPTVANPDVGTLTLFNHNKTVASDNNVHAIGYGGSVGGHFSVGVDLVTHHDFVQYSGAHLPT